MHASDSISLFCKTFVELKSGQVFSLVETFYNKGIKYYHVNEGFLKLIKLGVIDHGSKKGLYILRSDLYYDSFDTFLEYFTTFCQEDKHKRGSDILQDIPSNQRKEAKENERLRQTFKKDFDEDDEDKEEIVFKDVDPLYKWRDTKDLKFRDPVFLLVRFPICGHMKDFVYYGFLDNQNCHGQNFKFYFGDCDAEELMFPHRVIGWLKEFNG